MESLSENEISGSILTASIALHTLFGPGLFESVYEELLCYELVKNGLYVERQKAIPLVYESVKMEAGFRADMIMENKVLIEIKSVSACQSAHHKAQKVKF